MISRTIFEMSKRGSRNRRMVAKKNIRDGVLKYWDIADQTFPAPDNLKWTLFPLEKVVNGNTHNISIDDLIIPVLQASGTFIKVFLD